MLRQPRVASGVGGARGGAAGLILTGGAKQFWPGPPRAPPRLNTDIGRVC